ncbi:SGNH/GDSL hydrolase family protein [Acinetobacter sp. 102]|uniref:SGNH/GDSL hydrolase family protein n=1 Tax=Acinetobacter sp. 102 TaxID=3098766 RepID=UPI00300A7159
MSEAVEITVKISELDEAQTAKNSDFLPIVQDGETKKIRQVKVFESLKAGLGTAAMSNVNDFAAASDVQAIADQTQTSVNEQNERIERIEHSMYLIQNNGVFKSYRTKAQMLADVVNIPIDSITSVVADPDNDPDTNDINGQYHFNGSDFFKLPDILLSALQKYIDEAESSQYIAAFTDAAGNVVLGIKSNGSVLIPKLDFKKIEEKDSSQYIAAFADAFDNIALGIKRNGSVVIPKLDFDKIVETDSNHYIAAFADGNDNIAIGVQADGTVDIPKLRQLPSTQNSEVKNLKIGNDDSVMVVGDSLTAAHYCVQDKSYVSQLSQLTNFRLINYGVSGNDLLQMQQRVLNDTQTFGASLKSMKPRFALICSLANDGQFLASDVTYYQENTRRLVDVCLAHGVEPVLVVQFPATSTQHQAVKAIADEYNIALISNDVLNRQVGFYKFGTAELFHQSHTGTRNCGLFWLPMLEYLDQQTAFRTLKIYRKRVGFNVVADSDLLFKNRLDKSKKWKEISVGHYSLKNEYKYDELDTLQAADLTWTLRADEYTALKNGESVLFSDYCLVEIGLDALPQHLNQIKIKLTSIGNIQAYVRNNLETSTVVVRPSNPNDAAYQSSWNKNRGAWRPVTIENGDIQINQDQVIYSMVGNKVYLMLKGNFSLNDVQVEYSASKYEVAQPRKLKSKESLSAELLAQPLCGTQAQLDAWIKTGSVATFVPIDSSKLPRKSDQNIAVDGVITLINGNSIQQSINFPSSESPRTFLITVWGRNFPKAYFDMTNAAYSGLDANQIVDRNQVSVQTITKDSFDISTLKIESWTELNYPTAGGAEQFDFAGLLWRPIKFYIEVQPYETQLTARLSANEGEVQVAKVSFKEII